MKIWAWLAVIVLLSVPGMAHAASAGPARNNSQQSARQTELLT